jgi:antirestriction protein ArdC
VGHDGGQQAFYRPLTDTVHMPVQTRFASVEEYYSTLFHELSHNADFRIMPSGREILRTGCVFQPDDAA